jgi:DNA-binding response OmpR family regulator
VIILVIDDNAVNASALASVLRKEGHVCEWAADGFSGRARLGVMKPDAAVVDLLLPDVDWRLFLDFVVKAVPRVVVLTAAGSGEVAEAMKRHPGVPVLQKPADPAEVLKALGGGP